ncbi:hypothetical protein BJY59DRAFT_725039 [Rhodotorula toruloides]
MSTEEPSKCCVCGVPTTKRCQACAKSGIDLFFCSPEHQKLVWKHHKEVCGPNAHPFRFPPLSQDEVDELLALENQPVTPDDAEDVSVLIERFPKVPAEAFARFEAGSRQSRLGQMYEVAWSLPAGSFSAFVRSLAKHVPEEEYAAILALRELLRGHRARRMPLVTTASSRPPGFDRSLGAHWLQLSQYRHQAVVLVSLALTRQSRGPAAVPTRFVRAAFEQAFACLDELKPFDNAAHAVEILCSVSEILNSAGLQQLGVYRDQAGKLVCTCVCA